MKYLIISIFLVFSLNNVRGNLTTENFHSSTGNDFVKGDTIIAIDTTKSMLDTDSLERGYNIMLYLYRLQLDQMEQINFRDRRMIFLMGLIILVLLVIIVRLTSRKLLFSSFPYTRQKKGYQPGLVCLQMMHKYYYGKRLSYKKLQKLMPPESDIHSLSLEDLAYVAEKSGFDIKIVKAELAQLHKELQFPVILYMPNHMTVLYAHKNEYFYLADPYYGYLKLKLYYFATSWIEDNKNMKGIAVQLYPLKQAKRSAMRKYSHDKFTDLKPMDKKSWKNYSCEMDIS